MSQIGYMFLGVGPRRATRTRCSTLMTHAFFKALLFLAAGIVIHALAGEQDMRRMGGLRRYLPNTYWAFLIGALALAGIPPLVGLLRRRTRSSPRPSPRARTARSCSSSASLGTFLTGLYAFRMVFLVFGGEPSPFVQEHLHRPDRSEPWLWMGAAVAVLSVLSVDRRLGADPGRLERRSRSSSSRPSSRSSRRAGTQEWLASISAVTLGVAGIAVAWAMFSAAHGCASRRHEACGPSSSTSSTSTSSTTRSSTGRRCCSRSRCATGSSARSSSARSARSAPSRARPSSELREVQTGLVRTYALAIAGSVTVLAFVFVWVK